MAGDNEWISPADAADMVYDVRAPGCEGLGYGLLRPRSKGVKRSAASLVRAKLQPVRPDANSWRTRCGMPVTARDHRVVLARGVPDPGSLERLLDDYDAAQRPHQRVLAAVLTVKLSPDEPLHDMVDCATSYAAIQLGRVRRLTSVVVLHTPADELADADPHLHICVLARTHRASGWAGCHPHLTDDAHAMWADEWRNWREGWAKWQ